MTACGVVDSPQETEETMLPTNTQADRNDDYWIRINNVQVRENDLITFSGSTNISEGNCIFTELYADEILLAWWPVGKCFPITGADWQFSVLLGEEGAPDGLESEVQYSLQVFWPGAPNSVRAAFPFDLAPPPGN